MRGTVTLSHLNHPHVGMQKHEAVLRNVFLTTINWEATRTQGNVCPDTTDNILQEATIQNLMLSVVGLKLSSVPLPEAMLFGIAQNVRMSAFVLGASKESPSIANENYQYNKMR